MIENIIDSIEKEKEEWVKKYNNTIKSLAKREDLEGLDLMQSCLNEAEAVFDRVLEILHAQ